MSHNTRDVYLGKPEGLPFSASDVARFWAKVRRASDGACWPWTATRSGSLGYGYFGYQSAAGQQAHVYAHRMAYALSHGSFPDGSVLHVCDNPICCNPAHLLVGTHTDNMRDASAKGRLHVPRPRGQKLTDGQCDEMVALVQSGVLRTAVAQRFGVSKTFVTRLMKGDIRQYRPSVIAAKGKVA